MSFLVSHIGVIVSISNTASIITLALPTSDNNNNNNNIKVFEYAIQIRYWTGAVSYSRTTCTRW